MSGVQGAQQSKSRTSNKRQSSSSLNNNLKNKIRRSELVLDVEDEDADVSVKSKRKGRSGRKSGSVNTFGMREAKRAVRSLGVRRIWDKVVENKIREAERRSVFKFNRKSSNDSLNEGQKSGGKFPEPVLSSGVADLNKTEASVSAKSCTENRKSCNFEEVSGEKEENLIWQQTDVLQVHKTGGKRSCELIVDNKSSEVERGEIIVDQPMLRTDFRIEDQSKSSSSGESCLRNKESPNLKRTHDQNRKISKPQQISNWKEPEVGAEDANEFVNSVMDIIPDGSEGVDYDQLIEEQLEDMFRDSTETQAKKKKQGYVIEDFQEETEVVSSVLEEARKAENDELDSILATPASYGIVLKMVNVGEKENASIEERAGGLEVSPTQTTLICTSPRGRLSGRICELGSASLKKVSASENFAEVEAEEEELPLAEKDVKISESFEETLESALLSTKDEASSGESSPCSNLNYEKTLVGRGCTLTEAIDSFTKSMKKTFPDADKFIFLTKSQVKQTWDECLKLLLETIGEGSNPGQRAKNKVIKVVVFDDERETSGKPKGRTYSPGFDDQGEDGIVSSKEANPEYLFFPDKSDGSEEGSIGGASHRADEDFLAKESFTINLSSVVTVLWNDGKITVNRGDDFHFDEAMADELEFELRESLSADETENRFPELENSDVEMKAFRSVSDVLIVKRGERGLISETPASSEIYPEAENSNEKEVADREEDLNPERTERALSPSQAGLPLEELENDSGLELPTVERFGNRAWYDVSDFSLQDSASDFSEEFEDEERKWFFPLENSSVEMKIFGSVSEDVLTVERGVQGSISGTPTSEIVADETEKVVAEDVNTEEATGSLKELSPRQVSLAFEEMETLVSSMDEFVRDFFLLDTSFPSSIATEVEEKERSPSSSCQVEMDVVSEDARNTEDELDSILGTPPSYEIRTEQETNFFAKEDESIEEITRNSEEEELSSILDSLPSGKSSSEPEILNGRTPADDTVSDSPPVQKRTFKGGTTSLTLITRPTRNFHSKKTETALPEPSSVPLSPTEPARSSSDDEIPEVIEIPRRKRKTRRSSNINKNVVENIWIDEQTEILTRIFPKRDPSVLKAECAKMGCSGDAFMEFVFEKLDQCEGRARGVYEKRIERERLLDRYAENFVVEDFVKDIPDPCSYFSNAEKDSDLYKELSLWYLMWSFRSHSVRELERALRKNKYNLYLAYSYLFVRNVGNKKLRKRRGRTEAECLEQKPASIDLHYLKEVAFIENESKILDYVEAQRLDRSFDEIRKSK